MKYVFCAFVAFLLLYTPSITWSQDAKLKKIVGYLPYWSVDQVSRESVSLLTDIIYFGIDVDNNGNIDKAGSRRNLEMLDSLTNGLNVKKSVCFGGWGRSEFFEHVSLSSAGRKHFCAQVLELCLEYDLMSVDIDWEYPSTQEQRKGFEMLVQDLYDSLNQKEIEITVAVGFWKKKAELVKMVEPYISGVNLMTYDNYCPRKGHASLSMVRKSCQRFVDHGIPGEKIYVGVPFYGRHRWKREKTMRYNSVANPQKKINKKGAYKGYFFDTKRTLGPKLEYIEKKNLGGIMIWEVGGDVDVKSDASLLKFIHASQNLPK